MLSDSLAERFEQALFGVLGTCDKQNVPRAHRIWAYQLTDDRGHLRVFVPVEFALGVAEAVEAGGRVSLGLVNGMTAEAFQYKGKAVALEQPTDADLARFQAYRDELFETLAQFVGPEIRDRKEIAGPPHVVLKFQIEEVYNQTPGPNAGRAVEFGGVA
jgi:predicted pyridoxine 5'-phosphate oxidase superfamily flavin-nucleotide-binding protein